MLPDMIPKRTFTGKTLWHSFAYEVVKFYSTDLKCIYINFAFKNQPADGCHAYISCTDFCTLQCFYSYPCISCQLVNYLISNEVFDLCTVKKDTI